ncbi:TetR/AcrR family transcriptional regulator [Sorangium sp. So ce726]|uniref:TetR/AcrR family transcriptional regulator n=1 Tax=Sorangium sp. So ce726 TaxID=3133319 RepID=UPI003F641522
MRSVMPVTPREPSPAEPVPELERRRTGARGARRGGRSERVVRAVMHAAAAEIARAGYAALRVEDVAARAGVNKTTIYRRWPTKAELVKATLRSLLDDGGAPPDTGAVRLDLLELVRRFVASASTPEGQGIYRMLLAELHVPEVGAFARALRDERLAPWREVLERGVARGELPPGSDLDLLVEMIRGVVTNRLFRLRGPVDDGVLEAVVDIVVLGAKGGGALRRAASSPAAPQATARPRRPAPR